MIKLIATDIDGTLLKDGTLMLDPLYHRRRYRGPHTEGNFKGAYLTRRDLARHV